MGYPTTESEVDAFLDAFPAVHSAAKKAGLPSK
jgi:hypothetical protein